MKQRIISLVKIIGALIALVVIGCLLYMGFYQWRQSRQYSDRITIKAMYMQYACGDCSIEMKVKAVSNPEYQFITGYDIFPKPATKNQEMLCDYVSNACYRYSSQSGYTNCNFELIGFLHKNVHGMPLFDCSETPFFTVEKIRFSNSREWITL
jgi:hypothetical protein